MKSFQGCVYNVGAGLYRVAQKFYRKKPVKNPSILDLLPYVTYENPTPTSGHNSVATQTKIAERWTKEWKKIKGD